MSEIYKYELQQYENNPHASKENLTKNRTYYSMRWKGIAVSDDLKKLKQLCPNKKGYRIINLDDLEIQ